MRKLAILTLALAMLSPARGINRVDFNKTDRTPLELTHSSNETEHSYNLSLSDIVEFGKVKENQFYPFVANVQKGPNDQPLFNNINNPLYIKSVAVSAIIRNQLGKKARHEIRDIITQEIVGEYEADINFDPIILGKEYSPRKLDAFNKNYEVRWTVGKQNNFKEIGRMLFGKDGTRAWIR